MLLQAHEHAKTQKPEPDLSRISASSDASYRDRVCCSWGDGNVVDKAVDGGAHDDGHRDDQGNHRGSTLSHPCLPELAQRFSRRRQ